jgi:hypothetical protein
MAGKLVEEPARYIFYAAIVNGLTGGIKQTLVLQPFITNCDGFQPNCYFCLYGSEQRIDR